MGRVTIKQVLQAVIDNIVTTDDVSAALGTLGAWAGKDRRVRKPKGATAEDAEP